MTPRSSLRTLTNQPRHHAQRWVEKCGRSIKGSDTPHHAEHTFTRLTTPTPLQADALERLNVKLHQ